jgi:hypothetical protein
VCFLCYSVLSVIIRYEPARDEKPAPLFSSVLCALAREVLCNFNYQKKTAKSPKANSRVCLMVSVFAICRAFFFATFGAISDIRRLSLDDLAVLVGAACFGGFLGHHRFMVFRALHKSLSALEVDLGDDIEVWLLRFEGIAEAAAAVKEAVAALAENPAA